MKIAVCVKHVPEGTPKLDPGSKRLVRSGEGALNHFDANAVEEALKLKEASAAESEVVLVSLGPEKAMEGLRKALAMGADGALLVSDEGAAGSDLVATSYVPAKALEREGGGWGADRVRETAAVAGSSETREHSRRAERNLPILRTHDRFGNRIDQVELDPSWHWLLRCSV